MKNDSQQRTVRCGWKQTSVRWLSLTLVPALFCSLVAGVTLAQDVAPPEAKPPEAPAGQDVDSQPEAPQTTDVGPTIVYENSVNTRWKVGVVIKTGSVEPRTC